MFYVTMSMVKICIYISMIVFNTIDINLKTIFLQFGLSVFTLIIGCFMLKAMDGSTELHENGFKTFCTAIVLIVIDSIIAFIHIFL